jgi:hypothetical protein
MVEDFDAPAKINFFISLIGFCPDQKEDNP